MLRRGAAGHRKAVVGEDLAGARDMRQHAIENPPPSAGVIHPEFEEVAQKPAALRHAKGKRVGDAGALDAAPFGDHRVWRTVAVGPLVTQERDEIARRGKPDADHLRAGRFVPNLVDFIGGEQRASGQQPDRPLVDKFPGLGRDLGAGVTFSVANRQPCVARIGRNGGVIEAYDVTLARRAGADVELVANAAGPSVCRLRAPPAALRSCRYWRVALLNPIPTRPDCNRGRA